MLPNLVIIGAMKCETTSLRYYLRAHPEIAMAPGGLNFFVDEGNWHRGPAWYGAQFGTAAVRGDTSPRYANYPLTREVPERMHALLPDAKLLYIVRDPIERLVSHYCHYYAAGEEHRPLVDALRDVDGDPERNPYVCRGLYFMQLERFLHWYGPDRILVCYQDDLRENRLATLQRIFRFLGVDTAFTSPGFGHMSHRTADKRRLNAVGRRLQHARVLRALAAARPQAYRGVDRLLTSTFGRRVPRPTLPPDLREKLIGLYRDDARRVCAFVGGARPPWSVF